MYFETDPVQWNEWPKHSRDWLTDGPHVVPQGPLSLGHEVSGVYCLGACCFPGRIVSWILCLWGIMSPGQIVTGHIVSEGHCLRGRLSWGRLSLGGLFHGTLSPHPFGDQNPFAKIWIWVFWHLLEGFSRDILNLCYPSDQAPSSRGSPPPKNWKIKCVKKSLLVEFVRLYL